MIRRSAAPLIRPVLRALRKAAGISGNGIVLLYHRVIDLERDPLSLAVHPDRFAEQIAVLKEICEVVPLTSLLEKSTKLRASLTFDDGYADNEWNALSILQEFAVPATIFVTAGLVGSDRPLWWDRLEALVIEGQTESAQVSVSVDGTLVSWQTGSPRESERAFNQIHPLLRRLPTAKVDGILDRLGEEIVEGDSSRDRILNVEELRSLASLDLIEIGSHTMTHPLLSLLPLSERLTEIEESKQALEQLIGKTVSSFAYPYGGKDAFDSRTKQLVRESGYRLACANIPGSVGPRAPRFALPRLLIRDWAPEVFVQMLSSWVSAK